MKVLFLGNSHTFFNDMPEIFKNVCKEKGKDVSVTMQAHPGVTYSWHFSQFTELRFALMYGNYDYIIMQQAAHSPCPSKEETLSDAKKIMDLAKENGVIPLQLVPWAEKYDPGHQKGMYDIFSAVAKENDVKLIHAGNVFEDIFYNHKEVNMYWNDGEHASPYGSYCIALSAYATIFNESVKDILPNSYYTYIVSDSQWQEIQDAKEKSGKNPDDADLKAAVSLTYKKYVKACSDKEKIKFKLDEDKANIIKTLVDKYCLK